MMLLGLGYLGVKSKNLNDWRDFGSRFLGMELIDRSASSLAFRMDDRKQRVIVDADEDSNSSFYGWEIAGPAELASLADRLDDAGVAVARMTSALAGERHVSDGISFRDPAGNLLEVFHGPALAHAPFRPGRSISGFRTGPLGMGHVVLMVDDVDRMMSFYTELLGFRLSDYMLQPFTAYFFHTNSRHHSLAMVSSPKNGLHHLMVELFNLDDVGQAYDIAQVEDGRVGVTFGRHTNDLMTSFYANSPSRFMVEYGWGGRDIETETWTPLELERGPSLWGHDRSWLPPEARERAREMRMQAAAEGVRSPVHVMEGNHRVMPGTCPWWDAAKAT